MSERYFRSVKHVIPGQHIREYPNCTANSSEEVLKIEIKQYIPINNPQPQFGDVTIIATHASGFPKELYEPLWDTLFENASFRIRSIWFADMVNQNASGIINEQNMGNDSHWFDHSRDLLRMVDVFREHMQLPIVGIGHSIGAAQLVALTQIHPRLFSNLVLIEPQITLLPPRNMVQLHKVTAFQPDLWSNREEAEAAVRENPLFKRWDPRVLERHVRLFVRDTPTVLYPDIVGAVTKRTSKHQELLTGSRPNFEKSLDKVEQRRIHPYVDDRLVQFPFYASAQVQAVYMLPNVRPPVLFVHGKKSPIAWPEVRKMRVESCGTGVGGNGGIAIGQVKETLLSSGHFLPFDSVADTAKALTDYLNPEMNEWKRIEAERLESRRKLTLRQKQIMSPEVLQHVKDYEKERNQEQKRKGLSSKL